MKEATPTYAKSAGFIWGEAGTRKRDLKVKMGSKFGRGEVH